VDIFLGFAPYVAFFVVLRMGIVEAAMWAAFAVAALVALYGRWRGRSAKILEIGGVALFGLLALFTAVSHWEWTLTAVRLAVDLGLLAIVLVSIAVGRPFTIQYARERIAEQYWQTPLFLAVNRRITWVWAAAFAVLVAAHVATLFFRSRPGSTEWSRPRRSSTRLPSPPAIRKRRARRQGCNARRNASTGHASVSESGDNCGRSGAGAARGCSWLR